MKRVILFLTLACPWCFTSALAFGDDSVRSATPDEVIGAWQIVPFTHTPKTDKTNPWPLPYQWFRFYKDGTMTSIMQTEFANFSAKVLEQTFETLKPSAPRYTWHDGFMIVSNPDRGPKEVWEIIIFKTNFDMAGTHLLKGDIVMNLNDYNGSIVYHRILRKLSK